MKRNLPWICAVLSAFALGIALTALLQPAQPDYSDSLVRYDKIEALFAGFNNDEQIVVLEKLREAHEIWAARSQDLQSLIDDIRTRKAARAAAHGKSSSDK